MAETDYVVRMNLDFYMGVVATTRQGDRIHSVITTEEEYGGGPWDDVVIEKIAFKDVLDELKDTLHKIDVATQLPKLKKPTLTRVTVAASFQEIISYSLTVLNQHVMSKAELALESKQDNPTRVTDSRFQRYQKNIEAILDETGFKKKFPQFQPYIQISEGLAKDPDGAIGKNIDLYDQVSSVVRTTEKVSDRYIRTGRFADDDSLGFFLNDENIFFNMWNLLLIYVDKAGQLDEQAEGISTYTRIHCLKEITGYCERTIAGADITESKSGPKKSSEKEYGIFIDKLKNMVLPQTENYIEKLEKIS